MPSFSANGPSGSELGAKEFCKMAAEACRAPKVEMLWDLARFRLRFAARRCVFIVRGDKTQVSIMTITVSNNYLM